MTSETGSVFDLDELLARRMVVVSGKGGVGKTTVAAALALLAVRRGRRVLLAQFESNVDAGQLLGRKPVGTELAEVEPGLFLVNMTPRSALREYGMLIFRFRAIYRTVMENRTVRHFLRAIPGLDAYAMLGKAWYHTTQLERGRSRFDLVVVDAPPTGQAIKVLGVPGAILKNVPESMLTRDARTIQTFLSDPRRCGALLVTLAEELPVVEALELESALRERLGIDVAGLVVNCLYPPLKCAELIERVSPAPGTDERLTTLIEEAHIFGQRRVINERHLHQLRERSAAPLKELPLLFSDSMSRPQLELLVAALEGTTAEQQPAHV